MKKPAAKQTAAARPAKPAHAAKPAPAKAAKTQAGTHKHAAKASGGKHPAKAGAKPKHSAAQTKKRQLALDGLAACSAQALATTLELAGGRVHLDDIEALYWLTAAGPDDGASIAATLEGAQRSGLSGIRPAAVAPWLQELTPLGVDRPWATGRPLILGLQLPGGPHAVADDGRFWWSWGKRYDPADFPGAVIEETWQVTW